MPPSRSAAANACQLCPFQRVGLVCWRRMSIRNRAQHGKAYRAVFNRRAFGSCCGHKYAIGILRNDLSPQIMLIGIGDFHFGEIATFNC